MNCACTNELYLCRLYIILKLCLQIKRKFLKKVAYSRGKKINNSNIKNLLFDSVQGADSYFPLAELCSLSVAEERRLGHHLSFYKFQVLDCTVEADYLYNVLAVAERSNVKCGVVNLHHNPTASINYSSTAEIVARYANR